jgi:outer membrane lipoprotein-sorting protein
VNRLIRPVRPLALAACLAAAGLACLAVAPPAAADDRQALHRAFVQNLKLKSFKATMTDLKTNKLVAVMEFQAPDRYRMTPAGQAPMVIVGDTMYMSQGGQVMKLPMPKGSLSQFRNEDAIRDLEKGTVVRALGPGMVGGQPAMKYGFDNVTGKTQSRSVAWIGARSGHVLMVETTGKAGGREQSMRIAYSDFDSPAIRIVPPR